MPVDNLLVAQKAAFHPFYLIDSLPCFMGLQPKTFVVYHTHVTV